MKRDPLGDETPGDPNDWARWSEQMSDILDQKKVEKAERKGRRARFRDSARNRIKRIDAWFASFYAEEPWAPAWTLGVMILIFIVFLSAIP